MGIAYIDDISGQPLDKSDAYTIEITKFSDDKLQKSKRFYLSMASVTKLFGDTNYGWVTMKKGQDGKWGKVD